MNQILTSSLDASQHTFIHFRRGSSPVARVSKLPARAAVDLVPGPRSLEMHGLAGREQYSKGSQTCQVAAYKLGRYQVWFKCRPTPLQV